MSTTFTFNAGGAPLFAVEDGSGPALVMLHGGMASHAAVLPVVSPLTNRCRVITPDVRGNGQSHYGGPLTFDQLADDVVALLDHLDLEQAVVGGVSSGCGIALRVALKYPDRVSALVQARPVHGGTARGYTEQQAAMFTAMDGVACRAIDEGVQVLHPLYAGLPPGMRERALAMLNAFDPASVVTTSRFIASGVQPFDADADLARVAVPTLLLCGDDPVHPPEVSELYAERIPGVTVVPAMGIDMADAIDTFIRQTLRLEA